ncbi:MAG TPA: anthranilate synthase component I [Alcanivorax sp.]|jgi:anthranilate synthase component 1|uniref:Anthranilate synthase component 1 n=1 Tax=Alloalcanivorax venustensis ISO4 TaxID=1177184 RepID=A0ABS0AG87_9GAMM|nr:anthranilate synthase component I [Alloalcanivorax venustensis]MBL4723661.1 anthranilate synthase component I [Alcanivorax sp.]MCH9782479.1 anthranilate synthase component I [Gammaproteobacteria bacterium]MEC8881186.1 anthranilate synthase component I [Pseudomonadota bacterium]MBF5053142.1 anthranilate synthase, component I [Alloalcanivorax venustensis ISO4]MBT74371.1 anthranilate synthase component I [Alcanivorax sp.]|tara:strand:+ start:44493 stop:46004 length:1512 start_codon:yes stop_codon:yes gene_type:complete
MSPRNLDDYARQGYSRVPIVREVLADLDTPLSAYRKLAAGPYSYLFESVQGGERWGRYSIIGLPAREVVRITGPRITVSDADGAVVEELDSDDPIGWIEDYRLQYRAPDVPGLPRFNGGLVGYFGYDSVRYFEPRLGPARGEDVLRVPDILLMRSEEVVVFDNLRGSLFLIVHVSPDAADAVAGAEARLDELERRLRAPLPEPEHQVYGAPVDENDFVSEFPREQHAAAVEKIREYILAGDVMQVVPAQRMSCDFPAPAIDLYRALRYLNPSPYMFYLDLEDFHIAGSSPEILTRVEDDQVTVRPIAGTRKRGATPQRDKELEEELLADPKEIAEHLMLIDLGRNDVGRVAEPGQVRVTGNMEIERYSHVMHIVSNVEGTLRKGLGPLEVLAATFPAGTLSGAPKIRAMEIIDEVEPTKRGVYGGAVGYIGFNDDMDMAIAIRTAVVKDGRLYVQAGGGIVADSVPDLEWKETMNKARAVFRAVNMALGGLDLGGANGDGGNQ